MITSNIKREFNCKKEKLWEIVTNNKDYTWRSDLSKIKIVDSTHFIEFGKNDYPTYFTIVSKKEFKEYKFSIENTNIKGNWIGIFKELPNGNTEVDFTEEVEVSNSVMKLLAKPYIKNQQKIYLNDLEKKLKESE